MTQHFLRLLRRRRLPLAAPARRGGGRWPQWRARCPRARRPTVGGAAAARAALTAAAALRAAAALLRLCCRGGGSAAGVRRSGGWRRLQPPLKELPGEGPGGRGACPRLPPRLLQLQQGCCRHGCKAAAAAAKLCAEAPLPRRRAAKAAADAAADAAAEKRLQRRLRRTLRLLVLLLRSCFLLLMLLDFDRDSPALIDRPCNADRIGCM